MREGERFNSISHLVGAVLALGGSAVLITLVAIEGDAAKVVSYSVYGATLFLLYLISTLYHSFDGRLKELFRTLDHQAIYVLIAGTYTPFTMVALKGALGWWIFGIIWGLAALGIYLDRRPTRRPRILQVVLYVVMGWLCLFVLDPIVAALPPIGLFWLFTGGVFYSSGIVFFALSTRYPRMHWIWHCFVLAGSASHYFAVLLLH